MALENGSPEISFTVGLGSSTNLRERATSNRLFLSTMGISKMGINMVKEWSCLTTGIGMMECTRTGNQRVKAPMPGAMDQYTRGSLKMD